MPRPRLRRRPLTTPALLLTLLSLLGGGCLADDSQGVTLDSGDATDGGGGDDVADGTVTEDAAILIDPDPQEAGAMVGMTAAHNSVREGLGARLPALVWDADVAAFAQAWADELAANRDCDIEHRPRSGDFAQRYGENIYWSLGLNPSAADVVAAWASEVSDYDYDANACSGVCGHYTQIVWRGSLRVGCGMSTCGNEQVWVCNYDPPGNWIGEKPY